MKKQILLVVAIGAAQMGWSQNALIIPDTISGTSVSLNLQNGTHEFYAGIQTPTMGANGSILGPTLLLNKGDSVMFSVTNNIADTTTIHWHGLHVSSENDGGPHTTIPPGTTWSPSFTIRDKAATYWYHPHLHMKTNEHVTYGIAGMIIVRDNDEAALTLPRTYGVDDIPLVIQTKDFDANKNILVHTNNDDVVMVNATIDPYVNVPAQVIRYRILNGSSQRAFNLGLTGDMKFYQIASDGGLLQTPVELTRLMLAPGERAEILVDFSGMNGQTVMLMSYASELANGIYGATNPGMSPNMTLNGYNPNPLNGSNFNIIEFNIGNQTSNPVTSIPASLVTVTPIDPTTADITRTLTFSPAQMGPNQLNGKFLINNVSFDMDVINYTIPFNNIEIWELRNQSAMSHPFHIHDVQFYILDRDGAPPSASEAGRKDVVLVKPQETVRFIAVFETFANDKVPYMYHCHLLTHEDDGMMGQFVVSNPLGVYDKVWSNDIRVFPNPAVESLTISSELFTNKDVRVKIFSTTGILVSEFTGSGDIVLSTQQLSSGMYYVVLQQGERYAVKSFAVVR